MSAYVDKLESYSRDVEYRGGYYYAMYGHDIVASYRAKYKQKFPGNPLFEKKEPSFVEFVEYLIETPLDKYDEHWKPIFVLCPPCHFNFDIIVKMETFKRDTEFLLNQRGRKIDSKEINYRPTGLPWSGFLVHVNVLFQNLTICQCNKMIQVLIAAF